MLLFCLIDYLFLKNIVTIRDILTFWSIKLQIILDVEFGEQSGI